MKYHNVKNKAEMDALPKGTLKDFDVIIIADTRDVYSVPHKGTVPVFAFNIKPRTVAFPVVEHAPAEQLTIPAVDDKPLMRIRFHSDHSDSRPITWPMKHPYWCSGSYTYQDKNGNDGDGCIIVAYLESKDEVLKGWPEARNIEVFEEDLDFYTFTARFGVSEMVLSYYDLPKFKTGHPGEQFKEAVESFKAIYPECSTVAAELIPSGRQY